ncbi:Thioredoxin-2, partial [Haemophilus influenzae]
SNSIARS